MASLNNDIAKYLKGELSPAEMHALEQKALQDPFLAEALEGAEQAGAENFSLDIEVLQQSIQAKTKRRKPKTITLNGWGLYAGIAAGLTLVAVSTYIIFLSINQREEAFLSQAEKQIVPPSKESTNMPSPADSVSTKDPLLTETHPAEQPAGKPEARTRPQVQDKMDRMSGPATAATTPSRESADVTVEETDPIASIPSQPPVGEVSDSIAFAKEVAEEEADSKKRETRGLTDDDEGERDIGTRNPQTRIARRNLEPSSGVTQHDGGDISRSLEARFIRGKVVSSDNTGIAGVNVVIKGTNQGTVTDESGNYQIKIHPEQSLTFDFIGYSHEEIEVEKDSKEVNVRLNEDVQALSEVVVTGAGTITAEKPDVFEMAEPEGGRKAFKKFLEEKMQYPAEAIANKIEGKVTVQFSVEPDGTVTDFRILKGLGFGCDEELIRLIKVGPRWKPSKKNNQPIKEDVKVRLKFDLPE